MNKCLVLWKVILCSLSLCLFNIFFLWFVYWIYFVARGICCALCLLKPKKGDLCSGLEKFICLKEKFVQQRNKLFVLFRFFAPFVDLVLLFINEGNMVQCKSSFPFLLFWSLCRPIVFSTIFIISTMCFSFFCGPTWFLSLHFTSIFFHLKPMGKKISSFVYFLNSFT